VCVYVYDVVDMARWSQGEERGWMGTCDRSWAERQKCGIGGPLAKGGDLSVKAGVQLLYVLYILPNDFVFYSFTSKAGEFDPVGTWGAASERVFKKATE